MALKGNWFQIVKQVNLKLVSNMPCSNPTRHHYITAAMWAGFRHPQDSALLSAISAANIEWSSMREKKLLIIEESDD